MDRYVYDVIKQYYKVLSFLGYKRDSEVNKILALTFIYDMTQHDTHGYLRHEDYKKIEKALLCLNCGCTVPFPRLYDPKITESQCPDGWHDESEEEKTLDDVIEMKKEKKVRYNDDEENLTLNL